MFRFTVSSHRIEFVATNDFTQSEFGITISGSLVSPILFSEGCLLDGVGLKGVRIDRKTTPSPLPSQEERCTSNMADMFGDLLNPY